ncbi:MAG: cupin domain-containing protein [Candidatus Levybacteria bacterium]|nr:cupin domain-containing protein [Candidatus Levybacteria bacterium]
MNVRKVVSELKKKYPNKTIVLNPPENPTEIICEIEPAKNNEEDGIAIAIIDDSKPHYHKKATEFYEILRGDLIITLGKRKYKLKKGDKFIIKPGEIHSAKGNETWVSCLSKPGWRPEDHILVK